MTTQILYIPGLGDGYDPLRRIALATWGLYGVRTRLVPIMWFDQAPLAEKLARVEAAIAAVPEGRRIVLVGESAGASLALLMASRQPGIDRVLTVCGVASPETPVAAKLRAKAPAFAQAVTALSAVRVHSVDSIRAAIDPVVGKRYSTADGARSHTLWTIGHMTTISLCLTILAPYISGIAKKHKK